jgi:hypothetical protein
MIIIRNLYKKLPLHPDIQRLLREKRRKKWNRILRYLKLNINGYK